MEGTEFSFPWFTKVENRMGTFFGERKEITSACLRLTKFDVEVTEENILFNVTKSKWYRVHSERFGYQWWHRPLKMASTVYEREISRATLSQAQNHSWLARGWFPILAVCDSISTELTDFRSKLTKQNFLHIKKTRDSVSQTMSPKFNPFQVPPSLSFGHFMDAKTNRDNCSINFRQFMSVGRLASSRRSVTCSWSGAARKTVGRSTDMRGKLKRKLTLYTWWTKLKNSFFSFDKTNQ